MINEDIIINEWLSGKSIKSLHDSYKISYNKLKKLFRSKNLYKNIRVTDRQKNKILKETESSKNLSQKYNISQRSVLRIRKLHRDKQRELFNILELFYNYIKTGKLNYEFIKNRYNKYTVVSINNNIEISASLKLNAKSKSIIINKTFSQDNLIDIYIRSIYFKYHRFCTKIERNFQQFIINIIDYEIFERGVLI